MGTTKTAEGDREAAVVDGNCQQDFRPYQNYQSINAVESTRKAQYDALQVSLQRSSGWAVLSLNYSWAKSLGSKDKSPAFNDMGAREYWSVSDSNRGQVLNAAYVFDLPKLTHGNQILRGVANGWEFSGFTTVEEGQQQAGGINGTSSSGGTNAILSGSPDVPTYAKLTCNPKMGLHTNQFLNGSCYSLPTAVGDIGNTRVPYTPGPMYWDSDATIVKNFKIAEKQNLELKFAGFNFLNHSLLSFNGGDSNLSLNGNLTDTSNACPGQNCHAFGYADYHYGHRVLELAAKYSF
jgi:hypothetical protein